MTQEEKDLLLKDLCARLQYGVKAKITEEGVLSYDSGIGVIVGKEHVDNEIFVIKCKNDSWCLTAISEFVPYLRPMQSMTEEEKKEFIHHTSYEIEESVNGRHYEYYLKDYVGTPEEPTCNPDAIDWLNARHFDYRGLIKKGLALEAPEGMYNTKTE